MITYESWLRDIARLIVWYPMRWLIQAVPIKTALSIFRQMGKLHFLASERKRGEVARNMAFALGNGKVDTKWIQQYFETHYVSQLLVFLFPRLDEVNITSIHAFQNLNLLEDELSKGKGCIVLHAHFGPVHLPLFHFGLKGYPIMQVGYLRQPNGLSRIGSNVSFRLREQYEKLIPAPIMQANKFLRPAFEHLKNNGLVMITGDGTGGGERIGKFEPFEFLGQKMFFPIGPAALASRTNASIVPIFTIREQSSGRYLTVIERPMVTSSSERHYAAQVKKMSEFVKLFESYVKKYPYHWHFWDEFSKGNLIH